MPGARSHFRINQQKNPNNGGGCLCSPDAKITDCVGPYVVATHKEQFVSRNPYVVIGAGCAKRMCEQTGGMPEPAEPVVVEVDDEDVLADVSLHDLLDEVNRRVGVAPSEL